MILDWEQKITETCEKLGIAPEVYTDDKDLQEWMAQHFGFENYDSFFALATPKDIIADMALDMLPDHHNYEYALMMDCIELIQHNYALYVDAERTSNELAAFYRFMEGNFANEMKYTAKMKLSSEHCNDIYQFANPIFKLDNMSDDLLNEMMMKA